eukprot:GHVU01009561.1.p1 GENE.GHVU01009561.1~~GHVU01009561.1.p1  ORF type:complete len:157 (-),score=9.14 GHVU01009561.1:28-498(-)
MRHRHEDYPHRMAAISEQTASRKTRAVLPVGLQYLKSQMEKSWTYSISVDGCSKKSWNIFLIRIRFPVEDVRGNSFVLFAAPTEDGKSATLARLSFAALDALDRNWTQKLCGCTLDGCNTMRGKKSGYFKRLNDVAYPVDRVSKHVSLQERSSGPL